MKYWDKARIKRVRERERKEDERRWEKAREDHKAAKIARRSYTVGAHDKNAALMLDALGNPDRRNMVDMLRRGGAMSLSKLAKPFHLKLPTALAHIKILELAGMVSTHKQGRIRICIYNSAAFKELSQWLANQSQITKPVSK